MLKIKDNNLFMDVHRMYGLCHLFDLYRWRLSPSPACVFSFQKRGDFRGYLVWLSHPPPILIPAHAMKQNTSDMSGSKALSGCQKHLPKYLHLLLLFIHHQCRSLNLLLVCWRISTFSKRSCTHSTLAQSVCILGQSVHLLIL